MIALVVRFGVRDEASAVRFDEVTAEVVAAIREREPGTLVHATHTVRDSSSSPLGLPRGRELSRTATTRNA